MNILTDCIRADGEYKHLLRAIAEQRIAKNPLPIVVAGLCEGAADAAYAALAEDVGRIGGKKRPVLLVCPEEKECMRLVNLFRRFAIRAEFFVARDLNFYNIVASHEYEHERLKVLSGILCGELDVIVTTPDAALTYTIPPEKFISSIINIEYDKTVIEVAELAERLIGAGYVRAEMVDAPGQFATRGGIVDIYPPHARFTDIDDNPIVGSYPLRIELFGDEIDRMELFLAVQICHIEVEGSLSFALHCHIRGRRTLGAGGGNRCALGGVGGLGCAGSLPGGFSVAATCCKKCHSRNQHDAKDERQQLAHIVFVHNSLLLKLYFPQNRVSQFLCGFCCPDIPT